MLKGVYSPYSKWVEGPDCTIYEGAVVFDNVRLGKNVTIMPNAVVGRPVEVTDAVRTSPNKQRHTVIGDNCIVGSNAVIYQGVVIGDNTMVCDTACIREGCVVGKSCLIGMGVIFNKNATLGNRVKVIGHVHLTTGLIVEDDVFISTHVSTTNDNFMGRGDTNYKPPIIRRGAAIGQAACILPGVEIGENAIVGAGAVVTKDVAAGTVVMGVPARYVRMVEAVKERV